MPTYDYECSSCGHAYELFQPITARPKKKCPSCGERSANRLIGTGAGIIFKGSGFYETDYRSDSYQKAAKADSEAKSGKKEKSSDSKSSSDTKPSTKSESTKPSAKTEAKPKSKSGS